jgi:hypothetical protein
MKTPDEPAATEPAATEPAPTWLDLYDWRRRVARLYQERDSALRAGTDPAGVALRWRAGRDTLFKEHPQTPLSGAQRANFAGLPYFAYDATLCLNAELEPDTSEESTMLEASGPHTMRFRRAGRVSFNLEGMPTTLILYWIDVYGGGLFLPFRDATCGTETYGGGRYLVDTVKGSDFTRIGAEDGAGAAGYRGGPLVVDFNYAYNPSCAYDARWVCPLAPNENRLSVAMRAGEQVLEAH